MQSVDFFTPVVDDPYRYGQIAAANSLSDVYAMGAKPLTALNIVCFPVNCLDDSVLVKILRGGAERVHAAGAVVAGGHSIEDDEPKYGLSVTGTVDPQLMKTTCGARPGDQILLTKPLGTGLLTTALKGEVLTENDLVEAIDGMVTLNKRASEVMMEVGASASTDITGFGLIGHAAEMAEASQVGFRLFMSRLPHYPQALEMAEIGLVPVGSHRNQKFYLSRCHQPRPVDPLSIDLLCDPQTSGGLLLTLPSEKLEQCLAALQQVGEKAWHIGEVTELSGTLITLEV